MKCSQRTRFKKNKNVRDQPNFDFSFFAFFSLLLALVTLSSQPVPNSSWVPGQTPSWSRLPCYPLSIHCLGICESRALRAILGQKKHTIMTAVSSCSCCHHHCSRPFTSTFALPLPLLAAFPASWSLEPCSSSSPPLLRVFLSLVNFELNF